MRRSCCQLAATSNIRKFAATRFMKKPNLGKKSKFDIAHYLNKAVDRDFRSPIQELDSRTVEFQNQFESPFADASGLSPTCAGMRGYTWAAQDHTVEWKRHKLLEMRLRKRLWSIVEVTCREIFARELQKACGGISFGNPIRLHIFRLQRDKGRRRGLESGRRDKGGSS
ncbi:hypothetical protein Tco_0764783 [Tanacetum coccineum]